MDAAGERAITLLLVGSETQLGRSAAGALEGRGFRVAHAVGSEHAITLIRDTSPRVVVLDVGKDSGVALSFLASLRASDPRLPVILLTEEGDTDVAMFGLELGAADILRKPIDVDQLVHRVRGVVAGASATPREKTIAELMIPASAYQRVYEDDSVQRVLSVLTQSVFRTTPGKLTEPGHRTVLVYSRAGAFLGCIRVNDILELLTPPADKQSSSPSEAGIFVARCKLFGSMTAGEMLSEQRFVDVGAPLMEAVELMTGDNLINIPVLEEGELVGMLTDRNVLLEMCNLATGRGARWIRTGAPAALPEPRAGSARTGRRRHRVRRADVCPP